MSRKHDDPDTAVRIGWQDALGLRQPALPGWSRIREVQIGEAARLLPTMAAVNLLAALLVVATLWSGARALLLVTWVAALVVSFAVLLRIAHAGGRGMRRLMPDPHVQSMVRGTLLGLLWALPSSMFATHASEAQQLATCLICAGMMATAALTTMALPLGMIAALLLGSLGLSGMLAHAHAPLPILLLPQLYAIALGAGGVSGSLAFLRRCRTELEVDEKREVVSLLLREYDEDEADWLWQTDAAKALTHVSERLALAAASTPAALEGQSLPRLLAGAHWASVTMASELGRLVELLNGRDSFGDLQLPLTVAGEERWWSLSGSPRFDATGDFLGFRGKGSDVTEQRRSADRIDRLAKFDALTGLANRSHFIDQLRKALARAGLMERCGLLLVDLDKFKPVNDTLGHPVGDRLLKMVAERLRNLLAGGELAGRLGGDEFALLVPMAADRDRVAALAEQVIARLSEPFEIDGHLIRIGASLGSAIGPRDGRSFDVLVRHADLALYRAKDDGRGCHRPYSPALLAAADRRRAIESGLRAALDGGGLHLLYQPVADARSGRIDGFEALLRWTDPNLGAVPPALFMPIAEEARLGSRIGEWVLRTACAAAAQWPDDVSIAVNLSAEQLGDMQLAATVLSALARAGLAPHRLAVEISEAVLLRGGGDVLAVAAALRGIGVRIVLDDFGSGHAALAYVGSAGFNVIKLDHYLVRGVAAGGRQEIAMVRGIVALSESLGLATVAEGVETQDEHDGMRALGCRFVQGHLIGTPLPETSVRAIVGAEHRARAIG